MEQGQRSPSPACLMVLAEAYGLPVEELIAALMVDSLQTVTTLSSNLAVLEFLAVPVVRWRDVVLRHWHADPQLHGNAMRFASDLFDPVCRTLGVPLIVNVGYRPLECDTCSVREGAWASAHTKALAADVRPVGLYLSSAMQFLRDAVERGDLPYLDLAMVTASRAIHIQAAGPGQRGRQVVEDGVPDACSGRRRPARAERSPRRRGPAVHG